LARTGRSNAGAALGVAQEIQRDLGVYGATPDVYTRLKDLQGYIEDIQKAAIKVSKKQEESGGAVMEIVKALKKFLDDQAKAAGLGGEGAGSGLEVAMKDIAKGKDLDKVKEKLEEIDAKIKALKEAMKSQDVVIKTWYESE
jgi:hypothetical protein